MSGWLPLRLVVAFGIASAGLAACGGASPSSGDDLSLASRGVCDALAALATDREAAVRSFENEAHAPLHALAAADGLERTAAASVLETMGRVESDIGSGVPADGLRTDLDALLTAANAALVSLDLEPPACPSQ